MSRKKKDLTKWRAGFIEGTAILNIYRLEEGADTPRAALDALSARLEGILKNVTGGLEIIKARLAEMPPEQP